MTEVDLSIYDTWMFKADPRHDVRNLLPGISAHFMVLDPPIDRLAEKVAILKPFVNEIVIVDTGSSREDVEIMRSWNYKGEAPVIVVHEEFRGFGPTRTAGMARHRYEWTWVQDPDELPTVAALHHMRNAVDNPDRSAVGYLYLSLNWWAGRLGPQMEYHWHARLWKTKGSWMDRNLHELAVIGGKHERTLRGKPLLPKAPREAFVIHSKGAADIAKSDALYSKMGGQTTL
jgi:hypothetical protein